MPVIAALALWASCVTAGLVELGSFAYTPGEAGSGPAERPAEIEGTDGRPLLVVFAHPLCSCSQATMEELARIRRENRNLDIRVFLYAPAEHPERWEGTGRWQEAQRIPGARVQADPGGVIARRFQAQTSGQTFLYDAHGHLTFAGGITAFRGHFGDNAGHDAIAALLRGEAPLRRGTPVFGCGLVNRP